MKRFMHLSRVLPATLALTAFSCAAVSVTLLSAGCGGGGNASSTQSEPTRKNGAVTMTIKWPSLGNTRKIPLATRSITLTITGARGNQSRTVARPADGSPSTVTFNNLPIGDYTLSGAAFASADGTGVALARASTTVQFTLAEPTKNATLNLDTTIVRLAVTPTPVTLSLNGPGRTLALSASGYDATTGGNMVPVASVNYVVANTGIATVATDPATGVTTITAVAVGQTTITATDPESGLSVTVDVIVGLQPSRAWSVVIEGDSIIETGAVVSPTGNVFVGDDFNRVYGFTPANGTPLASFPKNLSGFNDSPVSQPIIIGDNVFAIDNSGGGFAFNAVTGADAFSVQTGGYVISERGEDTRVINKPAATTGGVIYAGTENGTLSKATPGAGGVFAVTQIAVAAGEVVAAPSVDPATGNVFVVSSTLTGLSAKLHAFRPNDSRLFPAVNLDGKVAVGTALSPDGSRVYAATGMDAAGAAKMYGINATTGAVLWTRTLPNAYQVSGAPVGGPDGTVYIGTWGGRFDGGGVGGQVFALDGASGAVKPGWPFVVPFSPNTATFPFSDIQSSVAIGPDGTIYAASVNGMLYALRNDGGKLWEVTVSDTFPVIATPAIGPDNTIYIGAEDGTFSAFR